MLATTLLPGFAETTVTTGLAAPTAMDFSPDGRLWVLEQGGNVKLVHSDGTTFTALHSDRRLQRRTRHAGHRLRPQFHHQPFRLLYYTNPNAGGASWATGEHNQLSRFTVNDSQSAAARFSPTRPPFWIGTI